MLANDGRRRHTTTVSSKEVKVNFLCTMYGQLYYVHVFFVNRFNYIVTFMYVIATILHIVSKYSKIYKKIKENISTEEGVQHADTIPG